MQNLILHSAQLTRKSAQEYKEEIVESADKFNYIMVAVFVPKRNKILQNPYQGSNVL